jgi:hypothetical protein
MSVQSGMEAVPSLLLARRPLVAAQALLAMLWLLPASGPAWAGSVSAQIVVQVTVVESCGVRNDEAGLQTGCEDSGVLQVQREELSGQVLQAEMPGVVVPDGEYLRTSIWF